MRKVAEVCKKAMSPVNFLLWHCKSLESAGSLELCRTRLKFNYVYEHLYFLPHFLPFFYTKSYSSATAIGINSIGGGLQQQVNTANAERVARVRVSLAEM
jgi:hypothetical protein